MSEQQQPTQDTSQKSYAQPAVIVELDLETTAGSPLGPNPLDLLGLDS